MSTNCSFKFIFGTAFVLLITCPWTNGSSNLGSLHFWRGKVIYITDSGFNLNQSQKLCLNLGGHLPTFQYVEHVDGLKGYFAEQEPPNVWVNATLVTKPISLSAEEEEELPVPEVPVQFSPNFVWADGTPFHHQIEPEAVDTKCLGLTVNLGSKMFFPKNCTSKFRTICLFPSPEAAKIWFNKQIETLNQTLNDPSIGQSEDEFAGSNSTTEICEETVDRWSKELRKIQNRVNLKLKNGTELIQIRLDFDSIDYRFKLWLGAIVSTILALVTVATIKLFKCLR